MSMLIKNLRVFFHDNILTRFKFLFCFTFIMGCTNLFAQQLDMVRTLVQQGKSDSAMTLVNQILQAEPDNQEALQMRMSTFLA